MMEIHEGYTFEDKSELAKNPSMIENLCDYEQLSKCHEEGDICIKCNLNKEKHYSNCRHVIIQIDVR